MWEGVGSGWAGWEGEERVGEGGRKSDILLNLLRPIHRANRTRFSLRGRSYPRTAFALGRLRLPSDLHRATAL